MGSEHLWLNAQLAEKTAERKIKSLRMHRDQPKLRTLAEASKLIRNRKLSPVELVRECLDRIDQLNSELNAFITVTAESALAEAKVAEREIHAGNWRGPLHGIPIGLKDLIDTAGVRTTAASAVFRDRVPIEDADVVKKLRAAGAVFIGKQNLHEFAYGGSSLISHFGRVRNPINPEFIAGGSSGGSAAAVASGMCYAAIGTDTAGSIREPAALCGIVGLKPSYGLVSARGVIPLSVSLDHVGPLTRTVEDAAIMLAAVCEPCRGGSYRESLTRLIRDSVLGVPRNFFFEDLDNEVRTAVGRAIDELAGSAKAIREVDLEVDTDRTLQKFEAFKFHLDMVARSPELYDPETVQRIRTGEGITEQEYSAVQDDLQKRRAEIAERFKDVDVILTPTTPIPAPRIAELLEDGSKLRPAELVLLRNTRPVNVWGLPAISVPCGFTAQGLPIGLQIIGRRGGEEKVLRAANAYEQLRVF